MTRIMSFVVLLSAVSYAQAQTPSLLLQEVTVIDATSAPARRNVDVLTQGDRIEEIGPHAKDSLLTRIG